MAIPNVHVEIQDGALGILPENTDGLHVKIGVSAGGVPNTIYSFGSLKAAKDTLLRGPLLEAVAHSLAVAGGPVLAMPVEASVPGSSSAVTKSGDGPDITVAGEPNDGFEVKVEIMKAGALGAATFRFTLDGGDNWSAEITVPSGGSYALADTGLTLTFPAGPYVLGDTYSFNCTAPGYSASDLNEAMTVLLADPRGWGFLHIVGEVATGTAAATLAGAVALQMASAENAYRYAFALLDGAPAESDSNLLTAFASFADRRVAVGAGYVELASAITGRIHKRPAAWAVAARAARAPIHEDLGRVASGPLPGVISLHRDEQANPGLDAGRFCTARTIIGRQGFYITSGRLMAPNGSDFKLIQHRRVMDRACAVGHNALLTYLNDSVRVDAETGFIDERDARSIDAEIEAALNAALTAPGHASSVSATVKRDENILSTENISVTLRVVPLGYARSISAEIGFHNPATQLV